MEKIFLKKYWIIGGAATAMVLTFYVLLNVNGVESESRNYTNAVILAFRNVRMDIEAHMRATGNRVERVGEVENNWRLELKKTYGVRDVYVDSTGTIIITSDKFNKAIVMVPVINNTLSWECQIYPHMTYKSLCTNFEHERLHGNE